MTKPTTHLKTTTYSVDYVLRRFPYTPIYKQGSKQKLSKYGDMVLVGLNLKGDRVLVLWYNRDETLLYEYKV